MYVYLGVWWCVVDCQWENTLISRNQSCKYAHRALDIEAGGRVLVHVNDVLLLVVLLTC
jgi:hypothetical protein